MRKVKDIIPFLYLTVCLKTDAVKGSRLTASGTETVHLQKSVCYGNIQWQCKFPETVQNRPPNNMYQPQASFSQDCSRLSQGLSRFGNQQPLGSPLLWWGQLFAKCWMGIRPIVKATNVTSASHQHRAVGRGCTSLSMYSVIQFLLVLALFQTSIFNAERLYTQLWICLSTWWEPRYQGPQPLHFTDDPLYFCSTPLLLAKLLARPQVNKGKPFLGFSTDKIINDDKQYRLYCIETVRDIPIKTQKISTKCLFREYCSCIKKY